MTENQSQSVNQAKTAVGRVVSNKMHKTIIVQVEKKVKHPLYGKYVKRYTKLYAHDEDNISHVGNLVMVEQTRPLSKTKRWKLIEVLRNDGQE